ncbi:MAG: BCCT family transporter [Halodesulfurarchaeum sp.]|nr:BCCT family transporter [Halodesulfurarchaeum sp.]
MSEEEGERVGETTEGLQVELFHPETDRSPGDTNIQKFGFDVHPQVFPISAVVITAFVLVTILLGDQASAAYTAVFDFVNANFGWFYILVVNIFIVALVYFGLSKFGKIRLGGVEAEEEFSKLSWMAMLFSAGMGIGLMFYSVAEPMWHYGDGTNIFPMVTPNTAEAASAATTVTFYHWGLHPWAVYGIVALGLGFFSFNRGLPLTFRSVFFPLLGERIYGWWGHVIDVITVFATLFGLGTSLGLGASQINAGLNVVAGVPQGVASQVGIIAVITAIATISVAMGLDRGVKRLSQINVWLMFIFLAFILVVGPTLYILNHTVASLGTYLMNLPEMAFFTGANLPAEQAGGYAGWAQLWTVFYWGWWIAWSPFVGLFIARISKGKTIREVVVGVLMIPTAFSFLWLAAFGGAGIFAQRNLGATIYETIYDQGYSFAMFEMLESFPLTTVTQLLAVLLVTTFFVTSSDSGSLVVDHLTSGGKHDVPRTQRIFWAITEGVVAAVLLIGGGLTALQTASVTTGLPFAVILLVMVYSIYKGLSEEYEILQSQEFQERVGEIAEGEKEVDTTGGDVVTGIHDSESDD